MNGADVLFSAATSLWSSPGWLIERVTEHYGAIDLDVCASADNAKARRFYSETDDGLAQPWFGHSWMNPPYSDGEAACRPNCTKKRCEKRGHHALVDVAGIDRWVALSRSNAVLGVSHTTALLPARTDAAWWQDFVAAPPPEFRGATYAPAHWAVQPKRNAIAPYTLTLHGDDLRIEITKLRGRLAFGDGVNSAPFPSAVVHFAGRRVQPAPRPGQFAGSRSAGK